MADMPAPDDRSPAPQTPPRSRLATAAAALAIVPPLMLAAAAASDGRLVEDGLSSRVVVLMMLTTPLALVLGIVAWVGSTSAPRTGRGAAILAVVVSSMTIAGAGWLLMSLVSGLGRGMHGRVLRMRGAPVLVPVRTLATPAPVSEPMAAQLRGLGPADRAALTGHWTLVAREEHTSIAAFERLGRALAAHDAPARLIAGATAAAAQEADHAARCFAVASACAEVRLVPGTMPADDGARPTLITLALEALIDGCAGEGAGAAEAELLATGEATAEPLRPMFAVIARDEAEHAELSWAVLEWCLAVGGVAVRRAVVRAATELTERAVVVSTAASSDLQRRLGIATAAEREAAWRTTLATVRVRLDGLLAVATRAA